MSTMSVQQAVEDGFGAVPDLIAGHAQARAGRRALVQDERAVSYGELDATMDRVASGLRRDGVKPGEAVALLSGTTIEAVTLFLGIIRAGCTAIPIAPSATPGQIGTMLADCDAQLVFVDADHAALMADQVVKAVPIAALADWLPAEADGADPVETRPDMRFNIIYSSGTTGTPKGIVQTHAMRWAQITASAGMGMDDAVTMVSTPIYSNTTLVSLLPTIALGGTAVLLGKFEARAFLEAAARERATHAMLVPVQYQRIMDVPDFDSFDLSSFRLKTCTSAPFSVELKTDVVRRWPGMLVEIYGLTEGGGTCLLMANAFPAKLHTVGMPAPDSEIRIVGEDGAELPRGAIGEVVGRSGMMMKGYHGREQATDDAFWTAPDGTRFLRHGDLGRFDEEGFLTLLGRSKDMIISGGFNVYPPDIEQVLMEHPAIADAAVIGVPSPTWGETPYAYLVDAGGLDVDAVVAWVNARVGKTQRLSGAAIVDELPRNAIGKVLKRELRDRHAATIAPHEMEN